MSIAHTEEEKHSIIESLLSIPGMLRASDLELKPRSTSTSGETEVAFNASPAPRNQRSVAANEALFDDSPQARIERIRCLVRTPIACSFMDEVLAIAEIRERISAASDPQGRSWAAVILSAARQALASVQLPSFEADLVRLAVILLVLQKLLAASDCGEDSDWVYRQTRSARARMQSLHPDAARWLQSVLGHDGEEGEQTDKSSQLKALAWQACRGVIVAEAMHTNPHK